VRVEHGPAMSRYATATASFFKCQLAAAVRVEHGLLVDERPLSHESPSDECEAAIMFTTDAAASARQRLCLPRLRPRSIWWLEAPFILLVNLAPGAWAFGPRQWLEYAFVLPPLRLRLHWPSRPLPSSHRPTAAGFRVAAAHVCVATTAALAPVKVTSYGHLPFIVPIVLPMQSRRWGRGG